jgi:Ca2+-binding EF-hand superfamily protein
VNYVLVIAFLLPCSALAGQTQTSRYELEEEFRALDLNGDGYVSAAEAAGFGDIVTRFDRADRNRDGKLSRAEFARLKTMKLKRSGSAAGGTAPRRESRPKP